MVDRAKCQGIYIIFHQVLMDPKTNIVSIYRFEIDARDIVNNF